MQDKQLMTSLCIMSFFEIADFVAYEDKKQLKLRMRKLRFYV